MLKVKIIDTIENKSITKDFNGKLMAKVRAAEWSKQDNIFCEVYENGIKIAEYKKGIRIDKKENN